MRLPLTRATWPKYWLELWAERSALMQFEAGLLQDEAERQAEVDIRNVAEAEQLTSPLDIACRHCEAPIGEKCTTKPQAGGKYVMELAYFHGPRWRDFNRTRGEHAAMDDWNKRYGSANA